VFDEDVTGEKNHFSNILAAFSSMFTFLSVNSNYNEIAYAGALITLWGDNGGGRRKHQRSKVYFHWMKCFHPLWSVRQKVK